MNEDLLNIVKIIRAKMNMIILALFISTSMIAGWSVVQLFVEQPYLEKTDDMLERVARDDLKLLGIVNDIRYDVIQVQQYLTDISATRGLDGLDDGFKQAALYAEDFRKAVVEAHEIAEAVNLPEVTGMLNGITENFGIFYDHGVKMAARYVAEGPEGGNKMMPEFDSKAKTLSGGVLNLFTLIGDNASADLLETEESIDTLKENNATMILLAIFPALLGVLAAVFGIVAVRRICKVLESDSSR
jgi:methyl-accepting chemotaxis protein